MMSKAGTLGRLLGGAGEVSETISWNYNRLVVIVCDIDTC